MSGSEVRLFASRWDMHALQALGTRDYITLRRVFAELGQQIPLGAVNTQVETFGFGAPMQFGSYGFFDKAASVVVPGSKALVDQSVRGDTLLHLALRQNDPQSALVLVQANASLSVANSVGETPLVMAYDTYAFFKLREKDSSLLSVDMNAATANHLQSQSEQYAVLFSVLEEQLSMYHATVVSTARDTLMKIYTECAPERVPKIDNQLHDFEFRERKLLEGVRAKYLS